MKFKALREEILGAVQTVQYSASGKGMMPILSGVKIEGKDDRLVLHATDLESYTVAGCAASVEENGVCVVSIKVLMDFLRDSRDEKLDVQVIGNEMVLEGEKAVFKLYTLPPEDFPNAPVVNIPVIEEMDCQVFLPAVQKVARAASRDEKRPTLMGILLEVDSEGMRMVSTDSYRLAVREIKEGFKALEEGQFIIPSSALANLARIAGKVEKMNLYRDENKGQVRFEVGEINHTIRLIEGKFPKYGQFIPENLEKTAEVEKEEFMAVIKRASLISSTIKMSMNAEGITVTSESREVGEGRERLDAVYTGESMDIAFNSRFLEDGVGCVDGEKMILGMTESLKPGVIKEKGGEDFLYIIMPIRL